MQHTRYRPAGRFPVTGASAGALGTGQRQSFKLLSGWMIPASVPLLKYTWSLISAQYMGAVDSPDFNAMLEDGPVMALRELPSTRNARSKSLVLKAEDRLPVMAWL